MNTPRRFFLTLPSLLFVLLPSCDSGSTEKREAEIADPASGSKSSGWVNTQFSAATAEVEANCPKAYPEIVTPLPEAKDFGSIGTTELMKMLESWNPALRSQAAKALSERGGEIMGSLSEGTKSENWMVRAGSLTALTAIIGKEIQAAAREDQQAIKERYADIISELVRLAGDERREVRGAALKGLETISPQGPEALDAMLSLINDEDDFIAQSAMIALDKKFRISAPEQDEVIAALKGTFESSLPRGKGHIVRSIQRMDPEIQRQFIPELLAHVDWQPRRDTMFAAGGQAEAVNILASLKEPQLIERLPKLMSKGRGPGFDICLDAARSYGPDAKIILPELKVMLAASAKTAKEAELENLRETVTYLESL